MGAKPKKQRSDITPKSQPSKAKERNEEYIKYRNYIRSKQFREVKKIVWPTKAQVINNTLVVIVVSIIAAICIFGLDTIFGFIVRFIYGV